MLWSRRRRGLVRRSAVFDQALMQVCVVVPSGLADFDESDTRFAQPPRHQALSGKGTRGTRLDTIGVKNGLGFTGNIQQIGNFALHLERKFIRLNDAVELIGGAGRGSKTSVHRLNEINLFSLRCERRL